MKHLEFVDKLNELGVSIRSNTIENKPRQIEANSLFGRGDKVEIKNLKATYKTGIYLGRDAFKEVIKQAIDVGEWKHSWHTDIEPENYEKLKEIIQGMILSRANTMEFLMTSYFMINKRISDRNESLKRMEL